MDPEQLLFTEDAPSRPAGRDDGGRPAWNILIVDDEKGVHEVTLLALSDVEFEGRGLNFLHAYSAAEARDILQNTPDIALALVDVVMETEHSGLELVRHIRETLGNGLLRIILRTGQPGQAPERTVIREFDINDYKEKTELSAQKLYSAVLASLRSYRDLQALEANRHGLERIIKASAELFRNQHLDEFIQGVLEQLIAILRLDNDSLYINFDCVALEQRDQQPVILAATGRYAGHVGGNPESTLDEQALTLIHQAISERQDIITEHCYVTYFSPTEGQDDVLYFTSPLPIDHEDLDLVRLFCQNVAIAYRNIMLNRELEETQREIVYMLGEAIETRSRETGSHVRRVAEYCRILGTAYGLADEEVEMLVLASPLHDFGKIGVPDAVLHKPGRLDGKEWEVMRNHASMGAEMLGRSNRGVMTTAAIIAGQHHEKWDGSGYPDGLAGEDIHIYARIAALADVYDALSSRRCYKTAWTQDEVDSFIAGERGRHFDPALVDILFAEQAKITAVAEQYPDP